MDPYALNLNLSQILPLLGVGQCLHILVYMCFRAGRLSRATPAFIYFGVLLLAFSSDFAMEYLGSLPYYGIYQWSLWLAGPPISVLLIIQAARITRFPAPKYFLLLLAIPVFIILAAMTPKLVGECKTLTECAPFSNWLVIYGIIAGSISLLSLWSDRAIFDGVLHQKTAGRERYWLIIALLLANIALLIVALISLSPEMDYADSILVRDIIGVGLVYLASTTLFRIYPQAVRIKDDNTAVPISTLSDTEIEIALKIERLMGYDKVYQEPAYSRADMARELSVSESVLSRIINIYFGKSFPQLLNENRIEDAKRLLKQTDAPVKTIAEEVGFNSLATFNRVFRDIEGLAPSYYRDT